MLYPPQWPTLGVVDSGIQQRNWQRHIRDSAQHDLLVCEDLASILASRYANRWTAKVPDLMHSLLLYPSLIPGSQVVTTLTIIETYCGLVTRNGDIDFGQHWFTQWFVGWRHQANGTPREESPIYLIKEMHLKILSRPHCVNVIRIQNYDNYR